MVSRRHWRCGGCQAPRPQRARLLRCAAASAFGAVARDMILIAALKRGARTRNSPREIGVGATETCRRQQPCKRHARGSVASTAIFSARAVLGVAALFLLWARAAVGGAFCNPGEWCVAAHRGAPALVCAAAVRAPTAAVISLFPRLAGFEEEVAMSRAGGARWRGLAAALREKQPGEESGTIFMQSPSWLRLLLKLMLLLHLLCMLLLRTAATGHFCIA